MGTGPLPSYATVLSGTNRCVRTPQGDGANLSNPSWQTSGTTPGLG